MKTAIINSDSYEKHKTGDGHPEQPKRVIAIKEKLKKRKDLIWDKPDNVPDDILSMTHSKDYINNHDLVVTTNTPDINIIVGQKKKFGYLEIFPKKCAKSQNEKEKYE